MNRFIKSGTKQYEITKGGCGEDADIEERSDEKDLMSEKSEKGEERKTRKLTCGEM